MAVNITQRGGTESSHRRTTGTWNARHPDPEPTRAPLEPVERRRRPLGARMAYWRACRTGSTGRRSASPSCAPTSSGARPGRIARELSAAARRRGLDAEFAEHRGAEAEARYAREPYRLYLAKVYGPRPTSMARLRAARHPRGRRGPPAARPPLRGREGHRPRAGQPERSPSAAIAAGSTRARSGPAQRQAVSGDRSRALDSTCSLRLAPVGLHLPPVFAARRRGRGQVASRPPLTPPAATREGLRHACGRGRDRGSWDTTHNLTTSEDTHGIEQEEEDDDGEVEP